MIEVLLPLFMGVMYREAVCYHFVHDRIQGPPCEIGELLHDLLLARDSCPCLTTNGGVPEIDRAFLSRAILQLVQTIGVRYFK